MQEYFKQIEEELSDALDVHGDFRSFHEAYAVLLEELDEIWDEIKMKRPSPTRIYVESRQLAAMALKLMMFAESKY